MLRQTAHPTESRYEILGLFTASMIAASMIVVAVGALLPYVSKAFPAETAHISILITALLFGATLTNAVSGAATDRFGDKRVLVACGIIMGCALLASSAIANFTWLAVWFVIYGMGFAAINPVGSHAILFFFKPQERGLAMGVRQMGMPLGGVLGAIVIAIAADYYGYRGALATVGALVLIITLSAAAMYREPSQLHGTPVRAGVLLKDMLLIGRDPRLILITLTCIVLFAAQVALMGFFPWTLVHVLHTTPSFACLVFVITQFAAAAGRLGWGWASDRIFHGRRMMPLAITCVLCALAALIVADIGNLPMSALGGIAVLLGISAEGWFGVAVVAMAEVGGEEHAGSALGFGLTWVMGTGIVTPAIFQAIMQGAGIPAAWETLAVLSLCGVIPAVAAMMLMDVKRPSAESA
ncbi:MAG: MFS transporter [Candidatus Eremiobacteraeota bacterium]|nr:MFS transporter [Candidatus Eremiobacteraeota bacterium]